MCFGWKEFGIRDQSWVATEVFGMVPHGFLISA